MIGNHRRCSVWPPWGHRGTMAEPALDDSPIMTETPEHFRQRAERIDSKFYEEAEKRVGSVHGPHDADPGEHRRAFHHVPEFNPTRKNPHWGRRKLARDR